MKPRVSNQKIAALTLVEVLVVIVVVGFLFVSLYPWPEPSAQRKYQRISCVNNLKQIGLCYHVWSDDHNGMFPMEVAATNGGVMELAAAGNVAAIFQVMSNELTLPKILICPADDNRVAATNFSVNFKAKNISYFIGLDGKKNLPGALLSGDDNLEINGHLIRPGLIDLTADSSVNWTINRHRSGNVVFADGSVEMLGNFVLKKVLKQTGIVTNRFILP